MAQHKTQRIVLSETPHESPRLTFSDVQHLRCLRSGQVAFSEIHDTINRFNSAWLIEITVIAQPPRGS